MERWNLQNKDVVGLIARNTENLAPIVFGLFFCGVSVNTLDTSFNEGGWNRWQFNFNKVPNTQPLPDEIINIFRYTKPKLIFCDADVYMKVKNSLETLENTAEIYIVAGKLDKGLTSSVEQILDQVNDEAVQGFR